LKLIVAVVLVAQVLWSTSAPAQTAPADTVAQIKAAFDQAMAKPLAERIPDLEALEQRIASDLFEGKLAGEQTIGGLRYLYHTRMQLAKHDEAYGTYCDYLHAVEGQRTPAEAYATYLRDLDAWVLQKDYPHLEGLCTRVREVLADHAAIAEAALYHRAYANYRMNGRLQRCIELCSALISEHPDSVWRPKAYRVLANAQLGRGEYDSALGTLSLLKQQYPDTQFEHYADMRPAAIWEMRGEPQKALEIYQQSLKNYPDQIYWAHIHRHMERLQSVIEQQLIQDALEGLGKKDDEPGTPREAVGAAAGQTEDPQVAEPHVPVTHIPADPDEVSPVASMN
jgi:tetratricopeptide (TPR) repeat protein